MGLIESWKAWQRGEPANRVFGYLYLSQDEIDSAKTTETKLEALNRRAFETGKWTEQQYLAAQARLHSSSTEALLDNPASSPWQGFKEGVAEGAANTQRAISGIIEAPLKFTLGSLPPIVWVLAGLWLAWKLGALDRLFKR